MVMMAIEPEITKIKGFPNGYAGDEGRCHESLLRSFQMVRYIRECLERGDSQKTILDIMLECGY